MKKTSFFRGLAAIATVAILVCPLYAPPPAWWAQRHVLTSDPANDYAAVNLGQVKQIATLARDELDEKLPDTRSAAREALNAVINSWSINQSPPAGVVRNDYAAVNIGQLKNLAKLFYDRLFYTGYRGSPLLSGQKYPWTETTSDDNDYAAANIGQVKFLFSFDLSLIATDADNDGLPDVWEMQYFGNLNYGPNDDPDGDGLTNLQELQLGTNPNSSDTDGDGLPDAWEVSHGTNPLVADGSADIDGDGLTNAQEYAAGTNPLDFYNGRAFTITSAAASATITYAYDASGRVSSATFGNLGATAFTFDSASNLSAASATPAPIVVWRQANNLPANGTGSGSDTAVIAGDGLPNLAKYAFGLVPQTATPADNPIVSLVSAGSSKYLALTYHRPNPAPADLVYTVEVSSDGTNWSSGSSATVAVGTTVSGGLADVTVRDASATGSPTFGRRIRLKIARTNP